MTQQTNPAGGPDSHRPVPIAAFDFDGTLTHRDTLLPFLIRSLGLAGFVRAAVLSAPWLAAYALGLMSNHRAKARLLRVSLAGWSRADAERHAEDFVNAYLPTQWQAWAMEKLAEHRRQGHCCVIVSASPGIYLHRVAAELGMDAVICTEMELQGELFTGRLATPNCHGEQKAIRMRAWLAATLGDDARPVLHAYGDSRGDKPLLRLADFAWYRGKLL